MPDNDLEEVARWMLLNGFTTGHGNTVRDLLTELDWQLAERVRAATMRATMAEHELRRLRIAIMNLNTMAVM